MTGIKGVMSLGCTVVGDSVPYNYYVLYRGRHSHSQSYVELHLIVAAVNEVEIETSVNHSKV